MGNDELTNYFEQAEYYKFKYEGDNDISLIALNQTLSAINELTKLAVNNQFEYEFKISATEKGSFILDIFDSICDGQFDKSRQYFIHEELFVGGYGMDQY